MIVCLSYNYMIRCKKILLSFYLMIISFWNSQKMGLGDKVIRRNSLTTLHPMPTQDPQPGLERQKTVPHGFNVCHNLFTVIFYRYFLWNLQFKVNSDYFIFVALSVKARNWLMIMISQQLLCNFSPIKSLYVLSAIIHHLKF